MGLVKASVSDHKVLSELTLRSKAYWGYSQDQLSMWLDELTLLPAYFKVYEVYKWMENDQLAGYFSFQIENSELAYIDNIFVEPDLIGQGYGKKLLLNCLAMIKETSVNRVYLISDPNAVAFYKHNGFHVISKKESSIKGRYLYRMELNIQ